MSKYQSAKEEISERVKELVRKGFLMATGGNISMRISEEDAFVITPSNLDYMEMTAEDVCVLDFGLNVLEGERTPSVESGMHGAIYQVRADVNAIVHTHQVYTSSLTLIGAAIPSLFDEQARFLGRSVEIIPYGPSGTGMLKNKIAKHVQNNHNAYMMKNHGALIFGHDMQRAIHNVEILEKCALAYLLALCTERKVSKIPLVVREVAFAKLRKDQKKVEAGDFDTGGE